MDGQADGVARIKRLLPGWLAAGAALATGLYAFLLHFLGGPLAKLSLLQLIVAIAFAVALLVPPYRWIARACWELGIAEVYNPARWRKEWLKIKDDLKDAFPAGREKNLAMSLHDQSVRLADLGRCEEALTADGEATSIYRRLAEADPNLEWRLAMSLDSQSSRLVVLQRWEEGLTAIGEAASIYRQLAEAGPDTYRPALAVSLRSQSGCLAVLGRPEQALTAIDEAVAIYRGLAEGRPDTFLTHWRKARPDTFLSALAGALYDQSGRLAGLGRLEQALAPIDEAVAIYRQLAEAGPDTYLKWLAGALYDQSGRLAGLQRWEQALAPIDEAVAIYRQLAEAGPDTYRPALAGALYDQSGRLAGLGRLEEALAPIDEAVAIYRQLAEAGPDTYLKWLAGALYDQSGRLVCTVAQDEDHGVVDGEDVRE
jgi:tetratricopeptide (TPR) repeat protein